MSLHSIHQKQQSEAKRRTTTIIRHKTSAVSSGKMRIVRVRGETKTMRLMWLLVSHIENADPAESMHLLIATPEGKTSAGSITTRQWSLLHVIIKKLVTLRWIQC